MIARCGCTATGWLRPASPSWEPAGRWCLAGPESATLRNWVEDAERADGLRGPASSRSTDSEEVRALKRRVAELERANEILKTSAAFFAQAELDRRLR